MATIKRVFIFITCISSGLAALFTLVALVTEQWVVTDNAQWVDQSATEPNTVEYGLFQGYFTQVYPAPRTLQLQMTCLLDKNVCAMLCGIDSDERFTLLKQLYNNEEDAKQNDNSCPSVSRSVSYQHRDISTFAREDTTDDKKFINAGVWLSTILFLILSIFFGLTSSALSIWNLVSNPVQVYFSIFGLYIYNAIALVCTIIAMCAWGIMHISVTFHDVGIFYTLTGQINSDKSAYLGYSFWLLIIPIVLYCTSILLLYLRQYLLSKDPGHKMVHREEAADPGIYLY